MGGDQGKTADPNLAKVGVEGSNPFARSKIAEQARTKQKNTNGRGGPGLFRRCSGQFWP
jgi:hypothetical protein